MSISAIQNSGIYQAPEVGKEQAIPAARAEQSAPSKEDRIVPEERAFDRYDREPKEEITVCDTGNVDREIRQLKERQEQLEQQLRAAPQEQSEAIRQQLDQVERELAQKDNDSYRRQHAVFS